MSPAGTRVVAYLRTSKDEQGAGLEAQRKAVQDAVAARGWELVDVYEEHASGRSRSGRPSLGLALAAIKAGQASALVVTKLDRLTRSLLDFAQLSEQVPLVVLEQGFDMLTSHGRAMAGMLAVFAQFERELISERTKAGLAVKRAQGILPGPKPADVPSDLIRSLHQENGGILSRTAAALNARAVPSPSGGGRWHARSVQRVLAR